MDQYEPTERTRVRRKPGRARYERHTVEAILDEALVSHVGFVDGTQPLAIPTIHARVGTTLYLHGSKGSRTLGALGSGAECCVTATLIDGIVLARSALHHSLNYRSAMVFGKASPVRDAEEKAAALEAVIEHIAPGRTADARAPSEKELAATAVVSMRLDEASAKVREGGPIDEPDDIGLAVWAGVLPLAIAPADPVPDQELAAGVALPDYVRDWRRP